MPLSSLVGLLADIPRGDVYIDPLKLGLMVVLFVGWVLFVQWVDKDAVRVEPQPTVTVP